MNDYDKLIISYIDKQLSADEQKKFEQELKINAELKDAFEKYKKVNELFSAKEATIENQSYFNGIVPQFRQMLEKESFAFPIRKIGFTFAAIILIVSSYLLYQNYFPNQDVTNYSIQSITHDLSEEEMNELTDYISDDYWNIILSEEDLKIMRETDLSLDEIIADVSVEEGVMILSDYQINEIYAFADEEEIEKAYNEVLTKRFF